MNMLVGLGRTITQRRCLARLSEEQQHQNRQTDDCGESGVGTHRIDEVVDRESECNGH
jgi:hypothetical protein